MRPPTAWASRAARKENLLAVAQKISISSPEEQYHNVILGTAEADLPQIDSDMYSGIQCPVLILTVADDDAHPVSTAESLHEVLAQSTLHVAADIETAALTWPDLIVDFVSAIASS